jgi:hypothetical protein
MDNRTSGDGQSSPDLTDRRLVNQEYDYQFTATLNSSIPLSSDLSRVHKKFFNLVEKVKKRKLKLKQLRSKLNINYDDDSNSEFDGISDVIFFGSQTNNSAAHYETTTTNDETNFNSKLARPNDTMNTSTATTSEKVRQIVSIYSSVKLEKLKNF